MRTTTFKRRANYLAGLLLFLLAASTPAAVTDSYTATYSVNYGFLGLGTLSFEMEPADEPGCYKYSGHGEPAAIVSMLVGSLSDVSRFCIANNVIRPQFFRHHEQGAPEDSYSLYFNWANNTVRYQNRDGHIRVLSLPESATDPLSLQVAARRWVANADKPAQLPNRTFTLVDEAEIKTYTLAVRPGGSVTVPAGRFDTLIVERVDDDNETLRFWLAKYAKWIPVKVKLEQDGRTITMVLTSLQRKQD